MVEEMYAEETKEEDDLINNNVQDITAGFELSGSSTGGISGAGGGRGCGGFSANTSNPTLEDQKPDYDSLYSVVNGTSNYNREHNYQFPISAATHDTWSYGAGNGSSTTGTGGGFGNGVSLTLGLKQHNDNNIQFGPPDPAFFFPRSSDVEQQEQRDPPHIGQFTTGGNMDEGGDVGDGRQNLQIPYRNMMGAQLLHDLTR